MKFIEINIGLSVRKDEVCSVEKTDTGCRVNTYSSSYESFYSYETILKILEQIEVEKVSNKIPVHFFAG